ncbi:hypothetical protein DITRI_Ditri07aG0011500 [Diplodiscus trichospermus]
MAMNTSIITDQSALLALKHHITDAPENILATNWSASTSVCNWLGVSCGSRHHRVTALDLSGMRLAGTLPPQLGNLSFLSSLSITNSSFHGTLPVQLSNLKRLRKISLGNNSFNGEIPSWFGSLTDLRSLYLYRNSFNGVIPSSLGNLSKLEILSLFKNQLSGSIPPSIFNISSLRKIDLSSNQLSGSIPSGPHDLLSLELINFNFNNLTGHIPMDMFDHLPKLKMLYLSYNMLSGVIPTSLFKCKELQGLSLSFNQLERSLPAEIGNLSLLQTLNLGVNHFEGRIPHQIGNLKNLEILSLGDNNLAGPIPPTIFNSSTLWVISLDANQLSGHLPSSLGLWLPNLEQFFLGDNQLSGSIPISIANASQLTIFDMPNNSFSGSIPDTLGYLTNLQILNLESNNLTSSGMSFLSSLTSCRDLQILEFNRNPLISGQLPGLVGNLSGSLQSFSGFGCNIKGSLPVEIGNLSGLISIKLDDNELTGTIPATIERLTELQKFSIESNNLEGRIPSELCHLRNLAFLLLTSNKLSGPIPACLGDLVSLRQLFLGSNRFTSSIPSTLTALNDLLILDLSSNSLTGSLPIAIGKWKVVTSMDFSNNHFSSDIPAGVGDLRDLAYFSISNNRISGSIPESFGKLLSLEFLDLSRNDLSGEIPKSLENLSYLKHFNVSFNKLQGEIPDGGSFRNYTAESFKGNEVLCGAVQLKVPSCKSKPVRNSKAATKLITYVLLAIACTIFVLAIIFTFLRHRKRKLEKLSTQEEDLLPLGTWRRISYHELSQATDQFSESRLLGKGSFGSVYHGILSDGMRFAIKVFKLELERALKSFDIECEVLRNIRHRNLTKIISSCSNIDFKALVLEYMPNGSLDDWLYSNDHFLDIMQRLNIMIDVASALEYLHHGHTTPVVHCDVKPSNVLLDEDMVAHLSDFGIAKLLSKDDSMVQTMTIATIGYMAPEYGSKGIISTKGDAYSFGIVMMETFTGKKPTDETFMGEMSLKNWVKESLSSNLNQVVDANLLRTREREYFAVKNCTLSILQLALECSAEIPDKRLDMKEIASKLKKIKVKLLKDIGRVE